MTGCLADADFGSKIRSDIDPCAELARVDF
jgi:hypothetical protein